MVALWSFIAFHWPQLVGVAAIAVVFLLSDSRACVKAGERTGLPAGFWKGLMVTAVLLIGISIVGMGSMTLLTERAEHQSALELKDQEISLLKREIARNRTTRP